LVYPQFSRVTTAQAARLAQCKTETPDWERKPFIIVPDLVVEVVSTHDSFSGINQKVVSYLNDGVRLIWIVDPQQPNVTVCAGDRIHLLAAADMLTGHDVLPGFSVPVAEIVPASS
jgi:Uma2 family endonuclease